MQSICQRTLALYRPGQPQPGVTHCYSKTGGDEARVCELCGEHEPPTATAKPKKGSFEDVFGHLGNPQEVADMWLSMDSELEAARATLNRLGYRWYGGQLWKPPLGPAHAFKDTEHGATTEQVSASAAEGLPDHHPV